jgi:hypothetical protein
VDLFSNLRSSSLVKSAQKAAPSYALSYDDVFGDDVRSSPTGDLFSTVTGGASDLFAATGATDDLFIGGRTQAHSERTAPRESILAASTQVQAKKPKGLFDSDSDSDDDLFGLRRKGSGGDLFSTAAAKTASVPVEAAVASMTIAPASTPATIPGPSQSTRPVSSTAALFADSDSDEADKLFDSKPVAVPKRSSEGLFD